MTKMTSKTAKKTTKRSTKKKSDKITVSRQIATLKKVDNRKIFKFVKSVVKYVTVAVPSATDRVDFADSFQLSSLNDATSLANLYDQYRIVGVRRKFIFGQNTSGAIAFTQTSQPNFANSGVFYHVVDYDDVSVLSATNTYLAYANVKYKPALGSMTVEFKPKIAMAIYGGSVFTSFGNAPPGQWIDTQSNSVPYFSSKYCFDYTGFIFSSTTNTMLMQVIDDYIIEFRNSK